MVDGAAGKIAADGYAHHRRTGEVAVGAPADERQLIAKLLHRWPDVIKELDYNHWLQSARRHAHGASHNVSFRERRIEHAIAAVLALQSGSQLEDSALALDLLFLQILFAAAIGHVFAEHDDPLVTLHLVLQAGVDQISHGLIVALKLRLRAHVAAINILRI